MYDIQENNALQRIKPRDPAYTVSTWDWGVEVGKHLLDAVSSFIWWGFVFESCSAVLKAYSWTSTSSLPTLGGQNEMVVEARCLACANLYSLPGTLT